MIDFTDYNSGLNLKQLGECVIKNINNYFNYNLIIKDFGGQNLKFVEVSVTTRTNETNSVDNLTVNSLTI